MISLMCDIKKILIFSSFLPIVLFYKIENRNSDDGVGISRYKKNRIAYTNMDSISYDIAEDIHIITKNENYDTINEENFLTLYLNDNNENIYKENDEDEKKESGCILGTADKYLNWWITENGKINCEFTTSVLDLSENFSMEPNFKKIFERLSHLIGTNIRFMSLASNNLSVVPGMVLRIFNETLEFLSLANNPLTGRDGSQWSIFPILNRLGELDLRNCSLQFLYDDSFVSMTNLRKLYLSKNKFGLIPSGTFQPLKNLHHLDLSRIENLASTDGFASQNPYTINADGLNIEYDAINSLTNLVFLDMSFTKISAESGNAFSNLSPKLRHLSLCHTGFQIIPPRMFSKTSVAILDLSGNPIIASNLYNTSFEGLENKLEILAFDDANIKSLTWLENLTKLKLLTLRGNNINILTNETFNLLENLIILDLSFNHISNWYHRIFKNNTNLIYINLRNNNINFMTPEMLIDFSRVQFLAIGSNNFLCNCLLRQFIDMASRNNCNVKCAVTHNTVNSMLFERDVVPESEEITYTSITSDFGLTTFRPPTKEKIKVHFNSSKLSFDTLADETFFELFHKMYVPMETSYNKMYQYNRKYNSKNEYGARTFQGAVETQTAASTDLTVRITSEALEIICKRTEDNINCPEENLEDHEYAFQLLDFDEFDYRCINSTSALEYFFHELDRCLGPINDLRPDLSEDEEEINQSQIISIVVALVIISILFYILCYYKWWYIRYFFILIKNATILSFLDKEKDLIKRENGNENFSYDVFVSYCEENRDWVLEEFLPNIEDNHQINVCLHERDFQVGLSILENIISCMDRSRALLLIVSENFLLSHWCQFEMHLAQYRLLETRRERLIIVLLEDIPKRKRPKTLHYLMKIKTYIKWPTGNKKHPFRSKSKIKLQKLEVQPEIINSNEAVYDLEEPETDTTTTSNNNTKDGPNVPEKLLVDERKLFWKRLKKALGHSRSVLKISETGTASFV